MPDLPPDIQEAIKFAAAELRSAVAECAQHLGDAFAVIMDDLEQAIMDSVEAKLDADDEELP